MCKQFCREADVVGSQILITQNRTVDSLTVLQTLTPLYEEFQQCQAIIRSSSFLTVLCSRCAAEQRGIIGPMQVVTCRNRLLPKN